MRLVSEIERNRPGIIVLDRGVSSDLFDSVPHHSRTARPYWQLEPASHPPATKMHKTGRFTCVSLLCDSPHRNRRMWCPWQGACHKQGALCACASWSVALDAEILTDSSSAHAERLGCRFLEQRQELVVFVRAADGHSDIAATLRLTAPGISVCARA